MYVSIDLGGTNTRIACSRGIDNPSFDGEPVRHRNTNIYEEDLKFIINAAKELVDGQTIEAIGIGTPGAPNGEKTQIASARNMPDWNGKPLVFPISEDLGCQVFYDNDAIAAGLGEALYGGQVRGEFHHLIWGTGIGGAAISYTNSGKSLEISKLIWKTHFKEWEADCGGAELTKRFANSPESFDDHVWEQVAEVFRGHLVHYVKTYQPKAIVFSGGLAIKHKDMILGFDTTNDILVKINKFGNDSGLMGGFGLIKHGLTS